MNRSHVNLADLELHTLLHKAPAIAKPTAIPYDLDPGVPADIMDCCDLALRLNTLLGKLKLKLFSKHIRVRKAFKSMFRSTPPQLTSGPSSSHGRLLQPRFCSMAC